MKRLFDVLIAGSMLLVAAPLMLLIAVIVRIVLGRPVLFRQRRQGFRGEPFHIIKFRTMTDDRDAHGALLPDDQRLPALGRFLRRTSLDELPQLLNVVRGDMSIVGPRPLLMHYVPLYTPEQARRLEVRPGITSWAQINGRNANDWETKLALDTWYVEHRSWRVDLEILLRTVWVVLAQRGVSHEGHATMPEFRGSAPPTDSTR